MSNAYFMGIESVVNFLKPSEGLSIRQDSRGEWEETER